jgi:hypothetical protein
MTRSFKLAGVAIAAMASCALAAGCSSGSSTSSSSGTALAAAGPAAASSSAAPTSAAAAQPGTSAPGATSAATKTTCSQLTYADIQPLMVDKITAVTAMPAGQTNEGQTCNWASSNTSDAMSITVLSGQDGTGNFTSDVASLGQDAILVPGVGDKAVRDGGHGSDSVSAIKGSEYCRVTPGDGQIPGVAALEQAAGDTSNIGDANDALEAAAAATLCNRIFGSGNTTPDLSGLLAHASTAATASASDQDSLPSTFAIPTDSAPSS